MKKLHVRELSRNQPILRFHVILQHDWSIEQCLLHVRGFFGGKTKTPCFDLFIHWLLKQMTNTYRNHFSRSYENRSILQLEENGVRRSGDSSTCRPSMWPRIQSRRTRSDVKMLVNVLLVPFSAPRLCYPDTLVFPFPQKLTSPKKQFQFQFKFQFGPKL